MEILLYKVKFVAVHSLKHRPQLVIVRTPTKLPQHILVSIFAC